MEFSSEKNAESFSLKVLQICCTKSENQNKRLIFQKRVAKNVLQDTQGVVLNSTRSHSTKLKKKRIVQFLVFFQNFPLDTVEAGVTTLPSVFLLRVKNWWKPENCFIQSTSSSKCSIGDDKWWLDNPANIVWMCDKVSHNVGKRQKVWFFAKSTTFSHCSTGHVKAAWESCHKVFAQILKEVTYMKTFKELFFPRSFSGRVEGTFDSLPENSFCQKLH